jgi:clathrin heavy chain
MGPGIMSSHYLIIDRVWVCVCLCACACACTFSVQDKACFAATLYTCYDLIRPDTAVELAWRNGYTDYAMPFIIQYLRHLHDKVKVFEERTAPPKEDTAAADAIAQGLPLMGDMMGQPLMITNQAYGGE